MVRLVLIRDNYKNKHTFDLNSVQNASLNTLIFVDSNSAILQAISAVSKTEISSSALFFIGEKSPSLLLFFFSSILQRLSKEWKVLLFCLNVCWTQICSTIRPVLNSILHFDLKQEIKNSHHWSRLHVSKAAHPLYSCLFCLQCWRFLYLLLLWKVF